MATIAEFSSCCLRPPKPAAAGRPVGKNAGCGCSWRSSYSICCADLTPHVLIGPGRGSTRQMSAIFSHHEQTSFFQQSYSFPDRVLMTLSRAVRGMDTAATAYALDIPQTTCATNVRVARHGKTYWQRLPPVTCDTFRSRAAARETELGVALLRLLPAGAFGHASVQLVVTGNVPVHRRILLEELTNEIRPLQPQVVFPALQFRPADLLTIERHRVSLQPVVRAELDQTLALWQRHLDPVLLPAIGVNRSETESNTRSEEVVLRAG
jgi:hypothetical protein